MISSVTSRSNAILFPPTKTAQTIIRTSSVWLPYDDHNNNIEPQERRQVLSSDRSLVKTTTNTASKGTFSSYDWTKSTEENYRANTCHQYGKYASLRNTLDHAYHGNYTKERQLLQDEIIDKLLLWNNNNYNINHDMSSSNAMNIVDSGHGCTTRSKSATRTNPSVLLDSQRKQDNSQSSSLQSSSLQSSSLQSSSLQSSSSWIVFTAGCMGAGKSWTIRHLTQEGYFFPARPGFVTVDPDQIRHSLPEFDTYAHITPLQAGEFTRKEAGLISELLTLAALEHGEDRSDDVNHHRRGRGHRRNVLVDGSLRDARWYVSYFAYLRSRYPSIRIGILFITAPASMIYARAEARAHMTGRVVPKSMLDETMQLVPRSVERLRPLVDFYAEINNAHDEPQLIAPSGFTWEDFRHVWISSTTPCNEDDENVNDADDDNESSTSQQEEQSRRRLRLLEEKATNGYGDETSCSTKT